MKLHQCILSSVAVALASDSYEDSNNTNNTTSNSSNNSNTTTTTTVDPEIVAEVEHAINERRHQADMPELEENQYMMCCYGGAPACDIAGCNEPSNYCSFGDYECGSCSRDEAINLGGAQHLARIEVCTAVEASTGPSGGPSSGPNRGDPDTMINGTRPPRSEWPEGQSPQCCWGGCGSCVDEYSFCSSSFENCANCERPEIDELARLSLPPVYHMCPNMMVNDTLAWAGDGNEFHCCWNDDCGDCDLDWCSQSFDMCGQCRGTMKACPAVSTAVTVPVGDAIPAVEEFGKEWWCCTDAQCGDSTCLKPGTMDGDWCLESTNRCEECYGNVTLCSLPPPPTVPLGESTVDYELPAGSAWTCCPDTCGDHCYALDNWCSEINATGHAPNCYDCNGVTTACPQDRRLVKERPISSSMTVHPSSLVVALGAALATQVMI